MIKYKEKFDAKYSTKIVSSIDLDEYYNSLEHYKDWVMLQLGTIEEERAIQSYVKALSTDIEKKIQNAKI